MISESALSAAIPIHELPSPMAVEENTTTMDQAEGLQNMSVRASGTKLVINYLPMISRRNLQCLWYSNSLIANLKKRSGTSRVCPGSGAPRMKTGSRLISI